MAKTPSQEDAGKKTEPETQGQWVKKVASKKSKNNQREIELKPLIKQMLDEEVTTTRHSGKIILGKGKPHWSHTEQVNETVSKSLHNTDPDASRYQFGTLKSD